MDAKRLKFLMDVDETFDKLSKEFPHEEALVKLQDKFYNLANRAFIKNAYQGLYEFSVEEVLKKQANEFYKNHNVPNKMKQELIESFVEMEHQKRRDNFEGFCVAVFKQIECCVVHFFKNGNLLKHIFKIRKNNTFTSYQHYFDYTQKIVNGKTNKEYKYGYLVENNILSMYNNSTESYYSEADYDNFFKNFDYSQIKIDRIDFMIKFRIVLFILIFNEKIEDFQFKEKKEIFESIRQVRNTSHGGGKSSLDKSEIMTNQQEIAINAIEQKYINYFKFQGFLVEFMEGIVISPNLYLLK